MSRVNADKHPTCPPGYAASDDDSSSSEESCLEIILPNGKPMDSTKAAKMPTRNISSVATDAKICAQQGEGNTDAQVRTSDDGSTKASPCDVDAKRNEPFPLDFSTDDDDEDLESLLNAGSTYGLTSKRKSKTTLEHRELTSAKCSKMGREKQKLKEKKAKAEKREQERVEKNRQKERERKSKAAKREQERLEKIQRKEQEKESKKRRLEALQQAGGKFAHQEIVVLMDPQVYQREELALVNALSEDFLIHEVPSALTCARNIQWIRKDYLLGGAQTALHRLQCNQPDHYEHLDRVIFIFEPEDFIPLLRRADHDVDDDYPALERWLTDVTSSWQTVWHTTKQPKLMLLLHQIPEALDRKWVSHRRHGKQGDVAPPTDAEMHDAIQWLLVMYQVECVHCESIEKIQNTVHKLTRAICEAPYATQVTELECIKKLKAHVDNSSGTSATCTAFDSAHDTWFRQLQQVPRLSEHMARNVVGHYPTLRSLWEAYQREDHEDTNRSLLADVLSDSKRHVKLSDSIYRFLASEDPNEIIF